MRLALAGITTSSQAVFADFYNLHADARIGREDVTARTANLHQEAEQTAVRSARSAMVVFGDTNSRYSRTGDVGLQELIAASGPGMTDIWVQLDRDGVVPTAQLLCRTQATRAYCATVDKVFYRTSSLMDISTTAFAYVSDRFLQADGSIPSDHNPILANFTWQMRAFRSQDSKAVPTARGSATRQSSLPRPRPRQRASQLAVMPASTVCPLPWQTAQCAPKAARAAQQPHCH